MLDTKEKNIRGKNMTYEEAKRIFFKYDCSLFGWSREEPDTYEIFRSLNIPKETLDNWKAEMFLNIYEQLKEAGSGRLFLRLCDIYANKHTHDKESLLILKDALNKVNYTEPEVNAYVCESLIGRRDISARDGLIFIAYDSGEKQIAEELMQSVLQLINVSTSDEYTLSRFEDIKNRCALINSKIN